MSSFQGRFGAQAGDYRAFRPAWPAEVFERILAKVPPPRRRALDLGAGTGLATAHLCEHFASVVALEPDARMLAEIEARPGLEPVNARAEDARLEEESFDLVAAGNAFHWMDGAVVLANARRWLRTGAWLALFRYDPPHAAAGALRDLLHHEYTVVWREHVHPRLFDPGYARRALAESSFGARMEAVRIANDRALSLAELMGFLRSTSYAGGHARSLADPAAYWRELERRVQERAGAGPYVLDFGIELLLARKEPA